MTWMGISSRLAHPRYESVGSIILFFVIASILSYPVSLVVEALPKALLHLKKVSRPAAVCLYLILDTAATALGLCVVDYFMESVSATELAILVVSFLLALLGVKDVWSGERTADDHKLMHGSI